MASRNFGSRVTSRRMDPGHTAAKDLRADIEAAFLGVEGDLDAILVSARNVVNGNIADLAAYTVASAGARNDATLNVEGDVVLLVGQTTPAQNGLYVVGAVAGGLAPLTRSPKMPAASTLSKITVEIAVGTVYSGTRWFSTAVAPVIGTTDPAFFPEHVTQTIALVAGTTTVTNVPLLSATKSSVSVTRQVANTSTATTGGYVLNGAPTPGVLGTATFAVMAAVAAGTINNADISTVKITVINR